MNKSIKLFKLVEETKNSAGEIQTELNDIIDSLNLLEDEIHAGVQPTQLALHIRRIREGVGAIEYLLRK